MTTPPPSRRVLVGGALAATARCRDHDRRPGVRSRRQARRPTAAQRPRPAPRHPLLLRPHAGPRARRTQGGRGAWSGSSSSSGRAASATRTPPRSTPGGPSCPTRPPSCGSGSINEVQGGWEVMANYQRRALQRRIRTNRPVLEMMTEFWENHLNVPVNGDAQFTYRASYGDHIREHALGRFSDLLVGAITHPAMLIYLDQATSTQAAPEREPRPRAARVPHRRPWQLHRGPRQGVGADPHRLHGRHVGDLAGALQPRGALAGHGQGDGLPRPQPEEGRPRR